jgi:hypothetical protein
MKLIHTCSLSATLDAVSEALFLEKKLPVTERQAAGKWIIGRQGMPGPYAGMLAPTDIELPDARAELRYTAPLCEWYLRQGCHRRRQTIVERILERA